MVKPARARHNKNFFGENYPLVLVLPCNPYLLPSLPLCVVPPSPQGKGLSQTEPQSCVNLSNYRHTALNSGVLSLTA